MRNIIAQNVNYALQDGVQWLKVAGVAEDSRNGDVLVSPDPVATTYLNPKERVLFNPVRDANPVFHLMESIWMLAGRNDVDWLLQFNSKFAQFAEPNGFQHGAYGFRWRRHWNYDQIGRLIEEFQKFPETRRAVLGMWDPIVDQGAQVKDVPCNTHIYFDLRGGKLNMTVCNRSNDIIWGAYGANVVHMSMLQELIACELNKEVGRYVQFSNNFHLYTDLDVAKKLLQNGVEVRDYYSTSQAIPMKLLQIDETWQDFCDDCLRLTELEESDWKSVEWYTDFFKIVAFPLYQIYLLRKRGIDVRHRLEALPTLVDWVVAFKEWVARRSGE